MDAPPKKPGANGTGYFTRCKNAAHTITIDNVTATYLLAKATAVQKTPAELIGEMVWEQMKVAM